MRDKPYTIAELMEFQRKNRKIKKQTIYPMLLQIDEELVKEEVPVMKHPIEAIERLQKRLNTIITSNDPLFKIITGFFGNLYPLKDQTIPPMHRGVFYFQGVIYEMYMGMVFGKFNIDIYRFIKGISKIKMQQLRTSYEHRVYIDQCCDLMDFGLGMMRFDREENFENETVDLVLSGKSQLNSMTESLLSETGQDAAMSNALLGSEMLLKGCLVQKGLPMKEAKKLSHSLIKIVEKLSEMIPEVDINGLKKAINNIPSNVSDRYRNKNYTIKQLGYCAMSAQFIAGEAMRILTSQNQRDGFKIDGEDSIIQRVFP